MHIHLDLVGGLAGDMFIAAALDADLVSCNELETVFNAIGLGSNIRVQTQRVGRGALTGTHIDFEGWDPHHDADHRHLAEILTMIDAAKIDDGIKVVARDLFIALGKAESKIHGIPLDQVHFHEVGAVDSILDFIGAATIIHLAQAEWSFGEVPCGKGDIHTAHGIIPVPAPATADLLRGLPTVEREVRGELVTPTGAAILHYLAGLHTQPEVKLSQLRIGKSLKTSPLERQSSRKAALRRGTLLATGYGCGTKNFKEIANVTRILIYDGQTVDETRDIVARVEADIDDMQPEQLAWFCESRLPELKAIDVVRTPVQMKKGRMATRVTVLCDPKDLPQIGDAFLRETSTFGVRVDEVERIKLARNIVEVQSQWGAIRVKIGLLDGQIVKQSPEFEDCASIAKAHQIPIQTVYEEAMSLIKKKP